MIDFSQVTDILLGASVVEQIADSLGNILWSASAETDEYFWIENKSPNGATATVTFKKNNSSAPTVTLYKSTDQVTWVSMGSTSTNGITATLNANQKMYFKATVSAWATSSYQNFISVSQLHNIGGNIMSLLYGDNYQNYTGVNSYAFRLLFSGDSNLLDASALKLPATTLANNCYLGMFQNCTMLTKAPVTLPATTLSPFCYSVMFSGCTYLTTTPELPATTLANNCYPSMFKNCTSLTTAPELPATTLTPTCYSGMFNGCSSLNYVKTYAEDISATDCLTNWLNGVANSGDFYNEGGATYTVDSPSGIPQGWFEHKPYFYVEDVSGSDNTLSITKSSVYAPNIEVFKSTDGTNWSSMGTTSDRAITATIPANGKLYLKATANAWGTYGNPARSNTINTSGNCNVGGNIMSLLYGDNFTGQTTFPAYSNYNFNLLFNNAKIVNAVNLILPATTLVPRCYSDMFKNCTSLITIPKLPATTLANYCYNCMFDVCTSLTTVPTDLLPVTTLTEGCYRGMFRNCTSLTTAPVLPATTLVKNCYQFLFRYCSNINYVKTYAEDISATDCLNNWLDGVAAQGDFYNLGTATYPSGTSGIPSGWTIHTSL